MRCGKASRPFPALFDPSLKAILHPTIVKHLPKYKDILKDIHFLYTGIQRNYRNELKLSAHQGELYLGVDTWQSPNGFDIMGIVIYQLINNNTEDMELEAIPLRDVIRLRKAAAN
ncbi:hypothetical protein PGTUg99_029609 [Puccinia graminis f. sp. tritici]|uniref:Uncharacterized protein n=1 Tax=Puccinia graminis f. sp. tritici TaxID=56615 RepID=A0A5B0LRS5_PUCGR|nr:hypothetical protein PGTUg99_029609 [Puccinia graminis f. sp. tritici]